MELEILIFITIVLFLFGMGLILWAVTFGNREAVKDAANLDQVKETLSSLSYQLKAVQGKIEGLSILSKVSEKTSDRAYQLASGANIAVGILQKALSRRPARVSRDQALRDEVAKKELNRLFGNEEEFDFFKAVMSDDELETWELARKQVEKEEAKLKDQK